MNKPYTHLLKADELVRAFIDMPSSTGKIHFGHKTFQKYKK